MAERITPIWCQVLGTAWQKACTAPLVLGRKRSLETNSTPEVPSETKPSPGSDGANAAGGGGIVSGPAGDHDLAGHAPARRQFGLQRAAGGRAFDQRRHVRAVEAGDGQQLVGPVALADIEPERAGGIGHVLDMLAGQQQAHIGLGQQHLGDLRIDLGLVLAHPGDLGRGEAGHRDIAGEFAQLGQRRFHLLALGSGAAIVPQDARTEDLVVFAQQHRAVHVTRKADAANFGQLSRMRLAQGVDRTLAGGPPIGGILLGPAGMRPHRFDGLGGRLAQRLAGGRSGPPSPRRCRYRCRDRS